MCKNQRVAIIIEEAVSSIENYGCGIGHCNMEDASGASRSEWHDMLYCGELFVLVSDVEYNTLESTCLDTGGLSSVQLKGNWFPLDNWFGPLADQGRL